ncbi:MerR family transcriptional regulator [Pseudomonas sp. Q1-7]|uniref:MerR family transcriptional regulator n=1 Tax=Pseudomonas sp. Q1-7 TaxID=3020843 RepID=UPI0023001FA0|nr:MerR family transcriptional regulator [Pseudomonas sp. Q1-7]
MACRCSLATASISLWVASASAYALSTRIIRYYERIALIPRPVRSRAGYRVYAEQDVQQLHFIHHA